MRQKGYIAFSSVLIISAVLLVIGVTLALTSISEAQKSLSGRRREETINRVEACIEDAIYSINTNNSLPSTITLPEGICSLVVDSHTGFDWTFTVSATVNGYGKSIRVITTRATTITPVSWKEI
ncbi:hypothetical protein A2V61_02600 [Candidatus Woesebacteria bacterium RBG_19FT_COMBO_47_8]|nr:MAG: hypothetical protein A2V61_02600 [Candidatus Woesebacteria bacterium RBG_19FT_COMBO_47_8]